MSNRRKHIQIDSKRVNVSESDHNHLFRVIQSHAGAYRVIRCLTEAHLVRQCNKGLYMIIQSQSNTESNSILQGHEESKTFTERESYIVIRS